VIAKVHTTNEMADDIEDIFAWGEDFEAILAILEEDETVDLHFTSATNETQKEEIICKDCSEKYKTKGGFERQKKAKHTTDSRSKVTPFSNRLLEA